MQPSEFVRKWNKYTTRTSNSEKMRLVPFVSPDPRISQKTQQFLSEAGLPAECSCGFEFDPSKNLICVSDAYGCYGQKGDWEPEVYARLHRYIYLGDDSGGNPICLDSEDSECVVFLDHEDFLSPNLSGSFVNSGVAELAACILVFQEMVEVFWQEQGEDAELYEGNVPQSSVEKALRDMWEADPQIQIKVGFWPQLLSDI